MKYLRDYTCKYCLRSFYDFDAFARHRKRHARKSFRVLFSGVAVNRLYTRLRNSHNGQIFSTKHKPTQQASLRHKYRRTICGSDHDYIKCPVGDEKQYKLTYQVFLSHVNSKHKCPYCSETFHKKARLKQHAWQPKCPCGKNFTNHEFKSHIESKHLCLFCNKLCRDKSEHLKSEHTCTFCQLLFKDLKYHLGSRNRCEFCQLCLPSFDLPSHKKSNHFCIPCRKMVDDLPHHKELKHICIYCQIFFDNLKEHEDWEHKCEHCRNYFSDRETMLLHVTKEHPLRTESPNNIQHECAKCMDVFQTECERNMHHLKVHDPDFKHCVCVNCNVVLTCERDRTNHEVTKAHCAYCKTCFSSSQELMSHWAERKTRTSIQILKESDELKCDIEKEQPCYLCELSFTGEKLKYHKKTMHWCDFCQKYVRNKVRHIDFAHKCIYCQKCFTEGGLKRHMVSAHQCTYCQKLCTAEELKHHINSKHKCPYCSRMILDDQVLSDHIATLHSNYKPLLESKPSELKHTCAYCPRKFFTKESFLEHIASMHMPLLQNECTFCQKQYTKEELKHHMNSKHKCPYCSKFTLDDKDLSLHIATAHHGKYKPFFESEPDGLKHTCSYCPRKFFTKKSLLDHIASMHTPFLQNDSIHRNSESVVIDSKVSKTCKNRAAYECPVCKCVFQSECYRNWHYVKIHNSNFENPHSCVNCQSVLMSQRELINHEMLQNHCSYCKGCFYSKCDLMAHWQERQKMKRAIPNGRVYYIVMDVKPNTNFVFREIANS